MQKNDQAFTCWNKIHIEPKGSWKTNLDSNQVLPKYKSKALQLH